ncbi:MAG: hypothetical protein ACKVWR_21810 [Acidimicrobiales bacterium]
MTIIDRQRRITEIGRIRMGEKRVSSSGKTYPASLDTFRLTSRVRERLEAAATIYGGTVEAWDDQYQLTTDTNALDVMIPPGATVTQWYELWSGGGCQRRCDGATELLHDQTCQCDPDNRECKVTSRVSVMLPRIPGLGVWRLDTGGEYAADELPGMVELLEQLGPRVAVKLRLERRTAKRDGETKSFVVPVFDADLPLLALMGGDAPAGYTPVQAGTPPVVAASRALEQANEPPPARAPRRNAQADIGPAAPLPPAVGPVPEPAPEPDAAAYRISDAQRKRLFAIAREHSVDQEHVKRILVDVTGQDSTSGIPSRDSYDAVIAAIQGAAT